MNRVGEVYRTKAGRNITIVVYENARKVVVEFEDGFRKTVSMGNITKGCIAHTEDYKIPKIGSRWSSLAYGDFTVVEYNGAFNVVIEFDEPHKCRIRTESRSIRSGEVKNPMLPDDRGFFFGVGDFDSHTKSYSVWSHIKKRVGNHNQRSPAYADCSICEEWHNFQNFAKWHSQQIGFDKTGWHVDKDILVKGNRIYSPTTCVVVPPQVNTMLTKRKADRGNTPIGVVIDNTNRPSCQYTENGEHVWRGYFETVEEAFAVYKVAKEAHIKSLANKWKDEIDPRAYDALMCYTVEITD